MSRLRITPWENSQRTVDDLYADMERRISAAPCGNCPVELTSAFLKLCLAQSCGKCVPCREGTKRMLEILTRIVNNEGTLADLDMLETLSQTITQTALCGLGQAACNPVVSTLRHFRNEYSPTSSTITVRSATAPRRISRSIPRSARAAASAKRTARWTRLRARRRNRIPSTRPSASAAAPARTAVRSMRSSS